MSSYSVEKREIFMHKKWMKWVCGMVLVSASCMGLAGCGGNELPKNAAASNEFSDSESKRL